MYCKKCGREIKDGSKFCQFCGTPQGMVAAPPVPPAAPAPQPVPPQPPFQQPPFQQPPFQQPPVPQPAPAPAAAPMPHKGIDPIPPTVPMPREELEGSAPSIRISFTADDITTDTVVRDFPCALGRDSSSVQIPVPDSKVSRKHAQIDFDGESVFIEDLQSMNGTIVNGIRIEGPTEIFTGDEIVLGTTHLSVEIST